LFSSAFSISCNKKTAGFCPAVLKGEQNEEKEQNEKFKNKTFGDN